jgi:hypothetical protein
MYPKDLNIRGIRRERAREREIRNTARKPKLSAQAAYAAAQLRKAKETKHVIR